MTHYLGFALIVGQAGSILGVVAGYGLCQFYTNFYISYINLPVAVVVPHYDTMLVGAIIGLGVPLTAGFIPAWGVLKLHPVESMRPPVPPGGTPRHCGEAAPVFETSAVRGQAAVPEHTAKSETRSLYGTEYHLSNDNLLYSHDHA
jgi:putative ABC transport system permease protein